MIWKAWHENCRHALAKCCLIIVRRDHDGMWQNTRRLSIPWVIIYPGFPCQVGIHAGRVPTIVVVDRHVFVVSFRRGLFLRPYFLPAVLPFLILLLPGLRLLSVVVVGDSDTSPALAKGLLDKLRLSLRLSRCAGSSLPSHESSRTPRDDSQLG